MSPHAVQLAHHGYAVLENVVDRAGIDVLRTAISDAVRALDPPTLWSEQSRPCGSDAVITPTGFALPRLLTMRPDLAPLAFPTTVRTLMREALGATARVELVGAVVTDRARPFFRWHTHIDGIEEGERRRRAEWPVVPDVQRVFTLLFLDDLDDESGPLLVHPRRVGAAAHAAFAPWADASLADPHSPSRLA